MIIQHRLLCMACVGGWAYAVAPAAHAALTINEVDYDQSGTDALEFVELYNDGSTAVNLDGVKVELINGASGGASVYRTFDLSGETIAAGDFFVICGGGSSVSNCDVKSGPGTNLIQNGPPDAVALSDAQGVLDRLSYEGAVPGFTEGAAGAGADTIESSEYGLSRCGDGVDTDDNAADFSHRPATPGESNDCGGIDPGGELGECDDPATLIHAIQGSGVVSPMVDTVVTIEAIVVGDYQDGSLNGFFVQEEDTDVDGDPATSEGIFVYEGGSTTPVEVGDRVRLRGKVIEFGGMTEISPLQELRRCASSALDQTSPVELVFPLATSDVLETVEGMWVQVPEPLTVTENYNLGRYGELSLSAGGRLFQPTQVAEPGPAAEAVASENQRRRVLLDDAATGQNPNPIPFLDAERTRRIGDFVIGLDVCVAEAFGSHRLQPRVAPVFESVEAREPVAPTRNGSLRVAAINVLNYFTTIDHGNPNCGPSSDQDCRGADSAPEFDRQRAKLLEALVGLDADILGLVEVENDADDSSIIDLAEGMNDLLGYSAWAAVETGPVGDDAIRVALLYRVDRVVPEGDFAILDDSVDPRFNADKNRPALAQAFFDLSSGALLTVVNNHLKSKGSPCDDVGDPTDPLGQGNCNGVRTAAAQALAEWSLDAPTGIENDRVLIIGDLNAYAKEDPITALLDGGFTDVVADTHGYETTSYVFRGQAGVLDHALASEALLAELRGVHLWAINAPEPRVIDYNLEYRTDDRFDVGTPYRASDHDPVLVDLSLGLDDPGQPRCRGVDATIYVEEGYIVGGPDDGQPYRGVLRGTQGADVIVGTDGRDRIRGRKGADLICGRAGDDRIKGNGGADQLFGEGGDDVLEGNGADDLLHGGEGSSDSCNGGTGFDTADGSCEITSRFP